jgi:hypothetical protein
MYIDTDDGVKTPVLDACMFLFCLLKPVDGEKFVRSGVITARWGEEDGYRINPRGKHSALFPEAVHSGSMN